MEEKKKIETRCFDPAHHIAECSCFETSPQPHREETNFMQTGDTVKCGHCNPALYVAVEPCNCVCHRKDMKEDSSWEEELDYIFGHCQSSVQFSDSKHKNQTTKAVIKRLISQTRSEAYKEGYKAGRNYKPFHDLPKEKQKEILKKGAEKFAEDFTEVFKELSEE